MTMKLIDAACNAALDAIVDLLDGGTGAGDLIIYDGTPPDNVDDAISTQTVLATLTLSTTAFSDAAVSGTESVATANTIADETNATAGTATFFRMTDGDGVAVLQGTCGTTDADLIMADTTITGGSTVSCTAAEVALPRDGG